MGLGPSFPIVIQSGLSPGAPATVGNIPQFAGSSPPDLLIDSIAREVVGPPQAIIIGATDPQPTATETLRTKGGLISSGLGAGSVVLGYGAAVGVLSPDGIAIGHGSSVGAALGPKNVGNSVVVGNSSDVESSSAYPAGAASVVIGPGNACTSTSGQPNQYNVILGVGNTVNTTIGSTARANIVVGSLNNPGNAANSMIVLGSNFSGQNQQSNGIAIGNGITFNNSGQFNCVAIGNGILLNQAASSSVVIGASAQVLDAGADNVVCIGWGSRVEGSTGIALGFQARSRGTAGIAIGPHADTGFSFTDNLVIGSAATPTRSHQVVLGGANSGGDYQEFYFGNRGALIANGVSDVSWRISDIDPAAGANTVAGNLRIGAGLGLGAGATGGEIHFETGAPGASGTTPQVRTLQFSILKSAGGAGQPNTAWDNVSNGAAAAAGTLLNAPSAGDPSMWLPVRINGAVRYIPCWT